jgi:hypothetical protein
MGIGGSVMAEPTQTTRLLPSFPGTTAARNPDAMPPSARLMMGDPIATIQPDTKAGGNEQTRVTDGGE